MLILIVWNLDMFLVTGLDLGEMQEREPQINDPYTTTAILSGLLSSTRYRIHIWARTTKGRGEGFFIELNTTQAGGEAGCFSSSSVCLDELPVLAVVCAFFRQLDFPADCRAWVFNYLLNKTLYLLGICCSITLVNRNVMYVELVLPTFVYHW